MSLKESTISRGDKTKLIIFIIDHHCYHRSTVAFSNKMSRYTGICVLMVQRCHLYLCLIFRMSRQFGERTTGHLSFGQSSALPPEFQLYTSHKGPLIVLQSLTILGVLGCSSMLQSSSSLDFKTYSSQISIFIVQGQEMKSYFVALPTVKKFLGFFFCFFFKVCPTSI